MAHTPKRSVRTPPLLAGGASQAIRIRVKTPATSPKARMARRPCASSAASDEYAKPCKKNNMYTYIPQYLGGAPRPTSHSGKSVGAKLQLKVVDLEADLKAAHEDNHKLLARLRSLEDSIDWVRACRVSGMAPPSPGR